MKISPRQIEALGQDMAGRFREDLHAHFSDYFSVRRAVLGQDGAFAFVDAAMAAAAERGFRGRAEIRAYLDALALLGSGFPEDPLLAEIARELDPARARAMLREQDGLEPEPAPEPDPGDADAGAEDDPYRPDPVDMLDDMHEAAWEWLDRTCGEDFTAFYAAAERLDALLGRPELLTERPIVDLCRGIWPEKVAAVSDDRLKTFLTLAARRAHADGVEAMPGVAIAALTCFVFGLDALHDPLLGLDGAPLRRGWEDAAGPARAAALSDAVRRYARRLVQEARAERDAAQAAAGRSAAHG